MNGRRFGLTLVLTISFLGRPISFAVDEARGWGSEWATAPESPQEKTWRRLKVAVRTHDWEAAETFLKEARRAKIKWPYLDAVEAQLALVHHRYADSINTCNRSLAELNLKIRAREASLLFRMRAGGELLAGDNRSAKADFEKSLECNKNNFAAQATYAWLLATCPDATLRDGKRALKFALSANHAASEKSPELWDTVAEAEAETGNFKAAIADEQQALRLAKKKDPSYRQHLEVFWRGQPVRESTASIRANFAAEIAAKPK